jgi:hypothetical protein
MNFFQKLFGKKKSNNPEDDYVVTITDTSIKVEHPERKTQQIHWNSIKTIKFINTDEGPFLPDIWLTLMGENEICMIPNGAKGYDTIYNIVSAYEGFHFEKVIESMGCSENAEFLLWEKT